MATGRLITIEGLDGAGKSTLALGLHAALSERGLRAELLREPGGVALSERIRALLTGDDDDDEDPSPPIAPRAEALLYAAARAQLVHERLLPLLHSGALVLLDRFTDSSLAYQGAGRELGVEAIRTINLFASGDLAPARTLLLRISPAAGRARQNDRAASPDRLEREEEAFFQRIAAAYDRLAAAEPERFRVLDATLPPAHLLAGALLAIEDLL